MAGIVKKVGNLTMEAWKKSGKSNQEGGRKGERQGQGTSQTKKACLFISRLTDFLSLPEAGITDPRQRAQPLTGCQKVAETMRCTASHGEPNRTAPAKLRPAMARGKGGSQGPGEVGRARAVPFGFTGGRGASN